MQLLWPFAIIWFYIVPKQIFFDEHLLITFAIISQNNINLQSVAREIPLKDQETVNTEEKNVQEDNSEDSKSKLGDSDCAHWIED